MILFDNVLFLFYIIEPNPNEKISSKALIGVAMEQNLLKSKTKKRSPRKTVSDFSIQSLEDVFGPPPLIEGECADDYEEIEHRLRNAIKPIDIIDEIWLQDIISSQWEILRLKRMKISIIHSTKFRAYSFLKQDRFGAHISNSRDTGGLTLSEALESFGYEEDALMARSFVMNLEAITMIDNQIFRLETRRNSTYREIENRRSNQEKKRQVIEDIQTVPLKSQRAS
jgi:hypothetical protein